MKKIINQSVNIYSIVLVLLVIVFASCKKDNTEGAPVITRVRTVYKSAVDTTAIYHYTLTADSNGVVTTDTVKTSNSTPQLTNFDSTTTSGNLNNMYAIIGQNLDGVTQVLFNGLSIYFNSALNSSNTIIVTIPQNTPSGSTQSNILTVVTTHGSVNYNFVVIAPPPTISEVSDYNFTAGSQITLNGIGFSTVTAVGLSGTTDTAGILSESDTSITLQMPATTANRANFVFTYGSGTATSTQEFVALDNAYQIYTDALGANWSDGSWSGPSGPSTAAAKTGTSSFVVTYPAGGWKIEGFANWYPSFDYSPDYKYLSFYVKGGTADHTLVLVGDKMDGGYSQNTSATAFKIAVPAGVWTYYKIPLVPPSSTSTTGLNFWKNGTPSQQLGFFLQGQTGDVDETMYFDDVIFVK